jgi:dTDP-4-amino-4,6-dideoxygalactose transaminase
MDAIQAAVLRVKLAHIESWNENRRHHASSYDRLLRDVGLLSQKAPVVALNRNPKARHVFHQYVIRAEQRDELRTFLAERKIGTEIYYPLPLHLQPVFSEVGLKPGDVPAAEQAAKEVLALPMFPELTDAELRWVVENIADFYS